MSDSVNHPAHYNEHPTGIECITIVEHMMFNPGNAVKYIWRAHYKGDPIENLKKAEWYVKREIQRLKEQGNENNTTGTLISSDAARGSSDLESGQTGEDRGHRVR